VIETGWPKVGAFTSQYRPSIARRQMADRDVPLEPIIGEPELAIAWLAERELLPAKEANGRFSLRHPDSSGSVNPAAEQLIIDNLGIETEGDLERVRERVKSHPRWPDEGADG
jgi:hypothetical protein